MNCSTIQNFQGKSLVFFLLLFLASSYPLPGNKVFRETTGGTSVIFNSLETPGEGGFLLETRGSGGLFHRVRVDKKGLALQWTHRDPGENIDYTAVLHGRSVRLEGIQAGQPVNREFEIPEDGIWIQSLEFSLGTFALGGESRIEFFTIQPGDLVFRKLRAQRQGLGLVVIEGEPVEAVEVRVSLPGFGSVFWGATYWFRATDGQFIRYEGVRGWPGTPKTLVELIGG